MLYFLRVRMIKKDLKQQVKEYVIANFGERCDPVISDDAPPCWCCEAWKAYDTIFEWEDDEQ